MRCRDATDMLADSAVEALGPMTWADLDCGDRTFTLTRADLLNSGSIIHARVIDRLRRRAGNMLLFGHRDMLRVMAARWLRFTFTFSTPDRVIREGAASRGAAITA